MGMAFPSKGKTGPIPRWGYHPPILTPECLGQSLTGISLPRS